jgi:hypothetical protein
MRITRGSLRLCTVAVIVLTALYFQFFALHVISRQHHHHHDLMMGVMALKKKSNTNIVVRGGEVTTAPLQNYKQEAAVVPAVEERCAINLYGLPRAFASIVLPSLVENVIQPNAAYHCDYFIHYYNLTNEIVGRFGQGGRDVNPQEILLLRDKVLEHDSTRASTVIFGVTQEEDFWQQYATILDKIHNTKDGKTGRYIYFPWKAQTYQFPATVDNIIKMWHSIQAAWILMERHAAATNTHSNPDGRRRTIRYTRVAMLRSDVMYLTPIDIWAEGRRASSSSKSEGAARGHHPRNVANNQAVIPGFGKHPVSDRMIYGPYDAVQIWATQRFSRLEAHAQYMLQHNPGWAMHSERFVQHEILATIEKDLVGFHVTEHDSMCFLRARVDESVWITDCGGNAQNSIVIPRLPKDMKGAVERILGRSCGDIVQVTGRFKALQCPTNTKQLAQS